MAEGMEAGEGSNERSLYHILGLDASASTNQIRRQYRKLCLKLHPDKNPGDEEAKRRFQEVQEVYEILGDPEKRRQYDELGMTDSSLANESGEALYRRYAETLNKVTEEELEAFERSYKGSDEERRDVLHYYDKFAGNMNKVFAYVMCSEEVHDARRFADMLDGAIAKGEVEWYERYEPWRKRAKKKRRRDPSAHQQGQEQDTSQVAALIRANHARRANAGNSTWLAQPGGSNEGLPTEEEFQAIQQRIEQRKQYRRKR